MSILPSTVGTVSVAKIFKNSSKEIIKRIDLAEILANASMDRDITEATKSLVRMIRRGELIQLLVIHNGSAQFFCKINPNYKTD